MKKVRAKLRVCASCEWLFHISQAEKGGCPKCGFGHYGARYVYGNKCYRYRYTQEPWLQKKLAEYQDILLDEINGCVDTRPARIPRLFGVSINKDPGFPIHSIYVDQVTKAEKTYTSKQYSDNLEL